MRPTPIPEAEIWPGSHRVMFVGPDGLDDEQVAPVEALVDQAAIGGERASVRLALEPGDLAKLAAGGHVWLSFYGAMVPWCVDVKGPGE